MNTESLARLADRELSVKARFGHVALLLAALTMSTVVGSLWLTEPSLAPRTAFAFAVMTAIGLCWAGYALWVLASRRVLLSFQQVVATRMAVSFCSAALAGALALAIGGGQPAAWPAAGVFAAMLIIAAALLARARRNLHRLSERRAALERQLQA